MLERVLRPVLFLGVLIPVFFVTKFISDYMLAGQPKRGGKPVSSGSRRV